jgi:hypothetical protein
MNRIPVQLNYKARRQFEAFHDRGRKQRWAVLVCHVGRASCVTWSLIGHAEPRTPKTARARKIANLTNALLRKNEVPSSRHNTEECMSCGYTYVARPDKGRFFAPPK